MNISMKKIFEKLSPHHPELYLTEKGHHTINSTMHITENQMNFESDILYVGDISHIQTTDLDHPINLLCVSNPETMKESLNKINLNMIIIYSKINVMDLLKEVKDYLDSYHRFIKNTLQLYDALASERGIQHIVDTAYKMLENPFVIVDLSYKLISYPKNMDVSHDVAWDEIIKNGAAHYDFIKPLVDDGIIKTIYHSDIPVLLSHPSLQYRNLSVKIVIGNKVVGQVCLQEYVRTIHEFDIELIQKLSHIISCEMQKSKFFNNVKSVMYEYFFFDLLENKTHNRDHIYDRLKYLDLKLKENIFIFTVDSNRSSKQQLFPYFRDSLESIITGCKAVIYKNNIILLITQKRKEAMSKSSLELLIKFLNKNNVVGGLSRCFHDITKIQEHYTQSIKAIELGIRLNHNSVIYSYNDYAPYHIMELVSPIKNLKDFCDPKIFDLIDYDNKNNTNYSLSLYVYLSNGNKAIKSAEILKIHRNTMDYHIHKINEIMNININNSHTAYSLYYSFNILEYLGDTHFSSEI